jgi:nickel-dependent lactate racemase
MTLSTIQTDLVQAKLIKTEIPTLLSKLVLNGKKEEALDLLIAWGTHQKDNQTIWNEAKALL